MEKAIDVGELWMRVEERKLSPAQTTRALAVFAKVYSGADSALVTNFNPFKTFKTFSKN